MCSMKKLDVLAINNPSLAWPLGHMVEAGSGRRRNSDRVNLDGVFLLGFLKVEHNYSLCLKTGPGVFRTQRRPFQVLCQYHGEISPPFRSSVEVTFCDHITTPSRKTCAHKYSPIFSVLNSLPQSQHFPFSWGSNVCVVVDRSCAWFFMCFGCFFFSRDEAIFAPFPSGF